MVGKKTGQSIISKNFMAPHGFLKGTTHHSYVNKRVAGKGSVAQTVKVLAEQVKLKQGLPGQ